MTQSNGITGQIEVVTIIVQDGQRQITTSKAPVTIHEKNQLYFIRYTEPETQAQVLIKSDLRNNLVLVRKSPHINRMSFQKGSQTQISYQTAAGFMELDCTTSHLQARRKANDQLIGLEWSYQLHQEKEILGDYQVKLHFML